MRVEKLFDSRFIRAADLNGKAWTGTIAGLRMEKLEGNTGPKNKGILKFAEWPDKEFVLNRTNASLIAEMFGPETDNWMQHRLTIHPVVWQGEDLAIRVKGSPDIDQAMNVELKLPRKKPVNIRLEKTGGAAPKPAAKAPNGRTPAPHADAGAVLDQARDANEAREPGGEG